MKRIFTSALLLLLVSFISNAQLLPEFFPEKSDDDVFMPTLTELLGEPVDDLGQLSGNEALKSDLVDYAKKFLGCRYRRGGKGPSVFDCSGFTSYVFRKFGYSLNPASRLQGMQGERVALQDAEVGDLMFFSGRKAGKTVGHVAMVIDVNQDTGQVKFIHASTSRGVVIETYPDGGYYSRRFLYIQRVLDDTSVMANN